MFNQFHTLAQEEGATHSFKIKKKHGHDFGIYLNENYAVVGFSEDSHAPSVGIKIEDVFVAVNGAPFTTLAHMQSLTQNEAAIVLSVKRS